MTLANSSSSTQDNSTTASVPAPPPQSTINPSSGSSGSITPLQLALTAVILGASAGLTLYTKRTSTMLNQLERASQNATQRRGPQKFGPRTKMEWEKMRNRWEKDDL